MAAVIPQVYRRPPESCEVAQPASLGEAISLHGGFDLVPKDGANAKCRDDGLSIKVRGHFMPSVDNQMVGQSSCFDIPVRADQRLKRFRLQYDLRSFSRAFVGRGDFWSRTQGFFIGIDERVTALCGQFGRTHFEIAAIDHVHIEWPVVRQELSHRSLSLIQDGSKIIVQVVLHGSIFRSQISKLIVWGAALTLGLSNETDFFRSMPGRGHDCS